MSFPSPSTRTRSWESWIRFALAVLLATVIYIPLALVPTAATPRLFMARDAATDIGIVALPPELELPVQAQFAHQLYYWMEINDPSMLILPDSELGFSGFLPPAPTRQTAVLEEISWEPAFQEKSDWQPIALTVYAPTAAQSLTEEWPRETSLMLPSVPSKQPNIGVFWRDQRGRILQNPPECPEAELRQALSAGLPSGMTGVEIQASTILPMFRIVIRQSCGNPELDSLVVRSIRRRLEESQAQAISPGLLIANPGGSITLEIDWRLSSQVANLEGTTP